MNPFLINPGLQVEVEEILESLVFTVDNFYSDPDAVVDFIQSHESPLWKSEEPLSQNGKFFEDRRLRIDTDDHVDVVRSLQYLCNQEPLLKDTLLCTNQTRFLDNDYNRYEDCVWFPHKDHGYTGIIFLNKGTTSGTNLYVPQLIDPRDGLPEHAAPWKPRHLWPILKSFTGRYNRMILFDAKKFTHGMAINDDRFFHEDRLNHVVFFREHSPDAVHG